MNSSNDANRPATANPWWSWPSAWTWPAIAPQQLSQPINPGWSFGNVVTVNQINSTAPQTERAVLERHSYGRQLGRIADAVAALIETQPKAGRADPRIRDFETLHDEIAQLKQLHARPQAERLSAELKALRQQEPDAYAALRAELDRG